MTYHKKKRFWYLSNILFIAGLLSITLVTYFLIQSIRETFYQNNFEHQYTFLSLEEDGDVYPIQVFHGVKVNTFVQGEEESDKKSGNIIFEVKDEPEAELKGYQVDSDHEGMSAFTNAIQYKVMVDQEKGKESFIVAMKMTPPSKIIKSEPVKYRTYSINENGVITESNFTTDTKSKLETQWIRGLSGEKAGYYSNLPYQKGGSVSLICLALFGIVSSVGGIWLRRGFLNSERDQAA